MGIFTLSEQKILTMTLVTVLLGASVVSDDSQDLGATVGATNK